MKPLKIIVVLGVLLLASPTLHAQNFLQKARNYLDAGECDKAQRAYEAYKVEHPAGDAEVKRRIDECGKSSQIYGKNKNLTFNVNGVTFKMVFVKGGTFQMGCNSEQGNCRDNEKPVHLVTLSDFYIGETEVTQELWQAVVGTSIYQQRDKWNTSWPVDVAGSHYPMYYVDDYEAEEFCSKINHMLLNKLPTGYKVVLPSEAQWEYAARGGNMSKSFTYAGSNYISDVAYFKNNSNSSLHEVGFKSPNELGLYDMSGNVWEMCVDWLGDYDNAPLKNPRGPLSGPGRVMRGGCSDCDASMCRVAYRWAVVGGHSNVGFRIALVQQSNFLTGEITYQGFRYIGEYTNNTPNGEGTLYYTNGSHKSGNWYNGKEHGVFSEQCSDGSVSQGEYVYGKKNGKWLYFDKYGELIKILDFNMDK